MPASGAIQRSHDSFVNAAAFLFGGVSRLRDLMPFIGQSAALVRHPTNNFYSPNRAMKHMYQYEFKYIF